MCAVDAVNDPNLASEGSNIGPRKSEMMKITSSIAAFQTIGPSATNAMQIRGLGGYLPVSSGRDLTNIYATMKQEDHHDRK